MCSMYHQTDRPAEPCVRTAVVFSDANVLVASVICSLPSCDWFWHRVYALFPRVIGSGTGYMLSSLVRLVAPQLLVFHRETASEDSPASLSSGQARLVKA
eukprot:6493787-Pyramimonas_sp.AAC.2